MLVFGILFEENKENIVDSIKKERFKTQPTNDSKNAKACWINHVNIIKIMDIISTIPSKNNNIGYI